jgi:excinuclease ABC subunit C
LASTLIQEQISRIPHRPGVYIMRNTDKTVIYVGKAIDLHNRVRSYFVTSSQLTEKTVRLVELIEDLDYFIASSAEEALILENNLIKQYRPRFNIRLKDDKSFPYLKINLAEEWPAIYITRRMEQDGGRYFGPFSSPKSVKQTLKTIQKIFPMRICTKGITGKARQPCLEYHMGRCLGPCAGKVKQKEYSRAVNEVILFLEGKQDKVLKEFKSQMDKASEAMDFEKAALLRDRIQAIHDVIEGEKIAAVMRGDEDVIAFIQEGDQAYVQILFIRRSKLIGREGFLLQGTRQEEPSQIMTSFVKQYYSSSPKIPPLLVLQHKVEDETVIKEWLKSKRKGKLEIEIPRRGNKKQLVDIAAENARQGLEQLKIKELTGTKSLDSALAEIQKELKLKTTPLRMEAYDISNIQGSSSVGSMAVFENGKPKPAHYRRFKIKTVEGANDYAMLQEVLRRRFKHRTETGEKAADTWAIMPDLVLIDGGKGQLNAALFAMKETGVSVPVCSLAKENEEIFLPGKKEPVVLPKTSSGLQLLQRLRDEAHRFAIGYFTSLHRRKIFASVLDNVPGVGPRRKSALLRHFGSVQRIREASREELAAATGMNLEQAAKIKEYL